MAAAEGVAGILARALRARGRAVVALGAGPRVAALAAALAARDDVAWRTIVAFAAEPGAPLGAWPLPADHAFALTREGPAHLDASLRAMVGPAARWPGFDLAILEPGDLPPPGGPGWVAGDGRLTAPALASAQHLVLLGPVAAPAFDELASVARFADAGRQASCSPMPSPPPSS